MAYNARIQLEAWSCYNRSAEGVVTVALAHFFLEINLCGRIITSWKV